MDKQSLLLNNLILHFASEMLDAPKPDWQNKTVDELSKQLHQTKDPVQAAILAATIWASKDQIQCQQN